MPGYTMPYYAPAAAGGLSMSLQMSLAGSADMGLVFPMFLRGIFERLLGAGGGGGTSLLETLLPQLLRSGAGANDLQLLRTLLGGAGANDLQLLLTLLNQRMNTMDARITTTQSVLNRLIQDLGRTPAPELTPKPKPADGGASRRTQQEVRELIAQLDAARNGQKTPARATTPDSAAEVKRLLAEMDAARKTTPQPPAAPATPQADVKKLLAEMDAVRNGSSGSRALAASRGK
jgi:hypothetical protein